MAVHTFTLTITNPDAWPPGGPQSNPPLYKFEFDGSPNHVQKFGHIWLGPLGKPLTIEWKIDPASNFVFQPNAAGDGTSALFLLVGQVTTDRVVEAFKAAPKFEIIASNLSHEQEARLKEAFAH